MQKLRQSPAFALFVLLGINTLNFYDRQIPGVVAKPLAQALQLDDYELGWINTAFVLLYAVVGLPLGRLSDVARRTWILAAGVLVWSLFTAGTSLAFGFWSLFFLRVGVGLGEATCSPACGSLLGDLYPPTSRAKAIAVFMWGLPLGLGLSSVASGWLASRDPENGWRHAFLVPLVPGLILVVAAGILVEPARGRSEKKGVGQRAGSPIRLLLGLPTIRWIIVTGALLNFCMYALSSFLTLYLQRFHHMDTQWAGFITGGVYGLFGGIGLFAGGWLGDRLALHRVQARLELSAVASILAMIGHTLALLQSPGSIWTYGFLLLFSCFFMYFYYGCVYASIHDIVEPALRGTAMGLYFLVMYFLGGAFGPVLTGGLSRSRTAAVAEQMGVTVNDEVAKAMGLHEAMWIIPVLLLPLALALMLAARSMPKDRQRLVDWQSQAV